MFVGQLADDLLEEILERDQASNAAVLINDDGHVETFCLHLAQHVVRGLHFDGELGGAHHLLGAHAELAARGLPARHEVLEV